MPDLVQNLLVAAFAAGVGVLFTILFQHIFDLLSRGARRLPRGRYYSTFPDYRTSGGSSRWVEEFVNFKKTCPD